MGYKSKDRVHQLQTCLDYYKISGLSQKECCEKYNIPLSTFTYHYLKNRDQNTTSNIIKNKNSLNTKKWMKSENISIYETDAQILKDKSSYPIKNKMHTETDQSIYSEYPDSDSTQYASSHNTHKKYSQPTSSVHRSEGGAKKPSALDELRNNIYNKR